MLSELLLSLYGYLGLHDDDFEEKMIIDEDLTGAITQLRLLGMPPVFDDFVRYLSLLIAEDRDGFLADSYVDSGTLHLIDFTTGNLEKKNRAFAYSDTEFAFFSAKSLFDAGNLVDFSGQDRALLWKQMQTVFERNYSLGTGIVDTFFHSLAHSVTDRGFAVKHIADQFDDERHYSYIYLSFLNSSNSITLPAQLHYSNASLNPTLLFAGNVNYEQYFDIYDVLNELNQAPDLLSRFLKLYHVFEYLIYRVYLVDLVGRVGRNKFFVREFMSTSDNMKRQEKEYFIKNFKTLFSGDEAVIEAGIIGDVNPAVETFLTSHHLIKSIFLPGNLSRVAELIYGIRCSIVHNKESEYHLTVSFYDDFSDIIPLIHSLIKTFENLLVGKIQANHVNIAYPQRELNLF